MGVINSRRLLSLWRSILLGAVNGLLSSSVLVVIERVSSYYADLRQRAELVELSRRGIHIDMAVENPIWWLYPSLWNVGFFIIASIFVHRFFAKRATSVFLIWQVVSMVVLAEWLITAALGVTVNALSQTGKSPVEWALETIISSSNQRFALKFITLVAAINVVYGTMMQIATKHYLHQRES